jgi:hypothetical protein
VADGSGFCRGCRHWQFELNSALRNEHEREGFGICQLFQQMSANPIRALIRTDDEFAGIQTRDEFGCTLFEAAP